MKPFPCPVCGALVDSYEIVYAYGDCPQGCGNPVETPCADQMLLSPCKHTVVGQENISALEPALPPRRNPYRAGI